MKIKSLFAGNRKGVVFSVDSATTLHDFGARQMYPGRVADLVRQTGHFICTGSYPPLNSPRVAVSLAA